jgi:hypothetical protein
MEEDLKLLYQESLILKNAIKLIDLLEERNTTYGPNGQVIFKHLIQKIESNVKVKMYQEHHNKPHVHIDIGKTIHGASVCIATQEILAGSIDRKYLNKVQSWVHKNQAVLFKIWENMQAGQSIDLSALN